jgi:hypothetical protein
MNKYCTDDFKLIIINNGETTEMETIIHQTCISLGLECIKVLKDHAYPSKSHFTAMNYVLNEYVKKDKNWDIAVIMDSDIFPFKKFSFKDIMDSYDIAGMYQQRYDTEIEYLCAIFAMFSNKIDITELDFAWTDKADTGGKTNDFLKKYNIKPKWIDHTAAIDIESDYIFQNNSVEFPYKKEYRSQFIAGCLFHYYRGGNWDGMPENYHSEKTKFLNAFLSNSEMYNLKLDGRVHYDKAHSEKGWNAVDHNYNGYKFIQK